ncbi:cyclopropane-fatty-acyl-phospholipid synthase family protein [Alphaproteobacteria bacterium]|nr:cyclopropane-fatty-acyl-phospholipid synthase family protein [Alphaproteobacteria bacterium]
MQFFNNYFNKSIKIITDNFLSKTYSGTLKVTYPNKDIKIFKGKIKGYAADIKFNNFKLFSKIIRKGAVGLAESYMDGDFETKDLSNLLLFAYNNEESLLDSKKKSFFNIYIKFKHYLNENTKSKSKKNISYHYDLGNNFYQHWLDSSMTYSSAIFNENNNDLFDAQINKYDQIAKPLSLNENSNLLEIGCGWGGFSSYAAKKYKSNVKAITISKEQYDYASEYISKEGLNEKVSIEMRDYRDINEHYSQIVSIEMFEAVGKKYWKTFLEKIKKSLSSDGLASLQIITIDNNKVENYQNNPDFIQQYIFPGGELPSKYQLSKISNEIGLSFSELQNFKNSYAKTLNIWNSKFQNAWPEIQSQGFSYRFKKMWEYYLSYCEVGFITGATDVSQFILKK